MHFENNLVNLPWTSYETVTLSKYLWISCYLLAVIYTDTDIFTLIIMNKLIF